jgi:hypothetical protein
MTTSKVKVSLYYQNTPSYLSGSIVRFLSPLPILTETNMLNQPNYVASTAVMNHDILSLSPEF